MTLLDTQIGYKPFRYPFAYELYKKQNQSHWTPDEAEMSRDVKDWHINLTEEEKKFLTHIFRFFVQSDADVQDNYLERYSRVFKPTEVKMMLATFAAFESIHVDAYSLVLETLALPESDYSKFMEYEEMRNKHEYGQLFDVNTPEAIAETLAYFGAFTEGTQLFASFAMLLNFPRHNKMRGMGQVVAWSLRDENLHCEGITQLFRVMMKEFDINSGMMYDKVMQHYYATMMMEDAFIDLAFSSGPMENLTADEVKLYTRFIADRRLEQLGYKAVSGQNKNPLPWISELMQGVEHANFFETRATAYAKGATEGTWEDAFDDFETE